MKPKLLGFILLLLLLGAGAWWLLAPPENNAKYPGMGGDFTLQSAQGPVSLHQFRGQVVLLYFGYTSCPDVCPASLGALASALKQTSPEERAQLQPLFISVDPERDSLEKLAQYAAYFYPGMLGLTGQPEYLKQLAQRYGAYFRKAPVENSALGYAVDHSATIFIVDKNGQLADMIHNSHSPRQILKQLRAALQRP